MAEQSMLKFSHQDLSPQQALLGVFRKPRGTCVEATEKEVLVSLAVIRLSHLYVTLKAIHCLRHEQRDGELGVCREARRLSWRGESCVMPKLRS